MAGLALGFALALYMAWSGVIHMVTYWERDEYSYAYFVPFLVAFFIWQKKNDLAQEQLETSWWGAALALLGVCVGTFGELGTLYVVVEYGLVIMLHGIALTFLGWRGYRIVAVPLALLFLVVPLPNFLYNNLSAWLQLISSQIGVWVVRSFGISVFLDGNVIQLANMKLQVAEACSGLRYLFPLMAVGFIMAYIYRAPMWKRVLLFLSSMPITVLMNSLRIGLIAVSVEYWGKEMAEGFLHDFEGWVVFMASLGVMIIEMLVLNLIGRERHRLSDTFYLELPGPMPEGVRFRAPAIGAPVVVMIAALIAGAAAARILPDRTEVIPERPTFAEFPSTLGEWTGRVQRLESIFVNALNFDDYLLANYTRPSGDRIELYVAYYESQRKGASVHSPKSCLPGGGWELADFGQYTVDGVTINGQPLRVNRSIIKKGDARQLVYYWFEERGRVMTNEYLVKLQLMSDAVTMNRSDGALVRLVTPLPPTADVAQYDRMLGKFAALAAPQLERFIPD